MSFSQHYQLVETLEPEMLLSINGMGAKLGEGMWAIEQHILDTNAEKQLS